MVEINMPNLGMTMLEGEVKAWLKADGEHVEAGEAVCDVANESGKLTATLEAEEAGTLRVLLELGEFVECGAVIGKIE